ncbi:hypothetical protein F8154_10270 [Alkaliphilus pronyensis]|uniref:Helix-turn-helix domain-containing protein n=1 Tax=Alkaliphilus pronyensis TaxID=1482732 RepID=A0A6I0F706_9FIRM|nr:hypothetical protein [Alkaliphilus pronyensis]KAB3533844.1 hypothetical protein F8154_10270 [Alkaliphilus pronyensis]
MGKRVGVKGAAEITGLSEWEIRTGARTGKYPHMRVGGERGRIIFDIEMLECHIRRMMIENIKNNESEELQEFGKLRKVY